MREHLTCPQCGAPIIGTECEYCGATFYDFSTLSMDKPCYIRLKTEKFINIFKAIVTKAEFNIERDDRVLYCDDRPYLAIPTPRCSLDISMDVLNDDNGIFLTRKEI